MTPGGRDPADPVSVELGEPEVAVGPGRDPGGSRRSPSGLGNSVTTPAVVIRPIWLRWISVNQRLPSGPRVMLVGSLSMVGTGNAATGTIDVGNSRSSSRSNEGRCMPAERPRPPADLAT